MGAYYMNEAVFALPDAGFVDRTVHDLDLPLPGRHTLGFLVVRTPLGAGEALADAVHAHVIREAKRLLGYRILDRRHATVGDAPAIELRARWHHEGTDLYTREAHLDAGGTRLTFAMTAPLVMQATCDEHLDTVLGSYRRRDA